jgi:hypothetical protein
MALAGLLIPIQRLNNLPDFPILKNQAKIKYSCELCVLKRSRRSRGSGREEIIYPINDEGELQWLKI